MRPPWPETTASVYSANGLRWWHNIDVADEPHDLKAVREDFEKECRARPGSLPEITRRYILKRFEIQARVLKPSSEVLAGTYPRALLDLVNAELGQATRIASTTWREGQLPLYLFAASQRG
jgi:hypothetical protein